MLRMFFLALTLLATPALAQRTIPTADIVLYVAPASSCTSMYWPGTPNVNVTTCGDDTNGHGTQAAPYATPQRARSDLEMNYDLQFKWRSTIQLAAGSGGVQAHYCGLMASNRLTGQGGDVPRLLSGATNNYFIGKYLPTTLRGDPANTLGALIYPGALGCANQPGVTLSATGMKLEGVTIDTASGSTASADCLDVFDSSFVELSNVWFGACAFLDIGLAWNSAILQTGPISVSGSAGIGFMQVAHSTMQGNSDSGSSLMQINRVGNPNFPGGFFIIDHGVVYGNTFQLNGTAQGPLLNILRDGCYVNPNGTNTCN